MSVFNFINLLCILVKLLYGILKRVVISLLSILIIVIDW